MGSCVCRPFLCLFDAQAVLFVFPIPPLEQVGIMLSVRGKVDGTAEHIEHTGVNSGLGLVAETFVQSFGTSVLEIAYRSDPQ